MYELVDSYMIPFLIFVFLGLNIGALLEYILYKKEQATRLCDTCGIHIGKSYMCKHKLSEGLPTEMYLCKDCIDLEEIQGKQVINKKLEEHKKRLSEYGLKSNYEENK